MEAMTKIILINSMAALITIAILCGILYTVMMWPWIVLMIVVGVIVVSPILLLIFLLFIELYCKIQELLEDLLL